MFLSLILICLLWAGLHIYVISRLLSIPFIAHHVPARLLIPVVILLGASYIVSRVLEHYSIDGLSHVLEIVGAYWVGAFFLLFSTFLAFDLCTGFGLWLRPQLPALRTVAFILALLMTIVALVQARRSPVVTEYEVPLDGLPREADGTVLVAASDMHLGALLGHGWASERAAQFESLRPDLLLLVGDIFEGDETTYPNWLPVLQQFRAAHGVYVVTGNHEFYAGGAKIIDLFLRAGFHVLRDESIEPIPGLVLTGVDDVAFRGRAAHAAIMEKVLRQRPAGCQRSALAHAAGNAASGQRRHRTHALRPYPRRADLALHLSREARLPDHVGALSCAGYDRHRLPGHRNLGTAHAPLQTK